MVELIGQLEFPVDEAGVRERLRRLAGAGEPVLLAEKAGEPCGLLDWHVMTTIHRPRPVGRVVALVVADGHRGTGIGRALMAEAERRMRRRGCEKMEVTSNLRLAKAHRFYEGLGMAQQLPLRQATLSRSPFDFLGAGHHLGSMSERSPKLRFIVHGGQVPARA